MEGMQGASAVPSNTLVFWPLFLRPKAKAGLVEVTVRVWWAYCQLTPKWKPSGMKATPAGLL